MPRNRFLFSLLAVPLLVLLVACGGGSKKDNSSSSSNSNPPSSSSGSSANSNSSSGGSSASSGSSSAGSNDSNISLENCKQYTDLETLATAAFGTGSSTQPKLDKGALDKLVKASPGEIRSDMQLVVSTIEDVFDSIDKLGVNLNDPASFQKLDAAKLQQLQNLTAKFDDQKFTDAADRIDAYFVKKCS